jgi:DNA-binding SARP family transcriptional activator
VRVLGPVEVAGPLGAVSPPGVLPRGFLAALALEAPRPVSIDRLTSLLWQHEPPNGVKAALQQLATRVRRTMASAGLPDVIRSVAPGYVLDVEPQQIDLRRFRDLVRAAEAARHRGEHAEVAGLLTDALALWRGNTLDDLVDLPLYPLFVPAIDDERARIEEGRARALMAVNRSREAASFLSAATARAPFDERLWAVQAEALVSDGRPAEAARIVRVGMAVVTAGLGVPPGPVLVEVERRIHAMPTEPAPTPSSIPNLEAGSGVAMRRTGDRTTALMQKVANAALDRAEQAAIAAHERRSHDEAVRQWQRAIDLLDTIDTNDDRTRLRLLLGLGHAHNMVSLEAEAQRAFLLASDVARRLGDPEGYAAAVLGYCSDRISFAPPAQQTALLTEALHMLGPGHHRARSRLLGRLATEMYWQGALDRTLELAEAALSEARGNGDTESRLWARYALAFGCWTPSRTDQLLTVCTEYLDDALAAGDRFHEMMARRWLAPALAELGDGQAALDQAMAAVQLADDLGVAAQQWMNRAIAAAQCVLVGELDRAEELATETITLGSVVEPDTVIDYVAMLIWNIHWARGDLGPIISLVEEVATHDGVGLARQLGLAMTFAEVGRTDEARQLLDGLTLEELDALPRDASWFFSMAALAESAAATADARLAAFALDRLLPFRGRIAVNSLTTTGPVAHQAGLAAWAIGRADLAAELFDESVRIATTAGAHRFAARSIEALDRLRAHGG